MVYHDMGFDLRTAAIQIIRVTDIVTVQPIRDSLPVEAHIGEGHRLSIKLRPII